ncbi:Uncharacterized protein Rs2_18781 [Raphanus sativus]|nr:Uncharacterized protein Rs2_18781 [Raphanus sativus]
MHALRQTVLNTVEIVRGSIQHQGHQRIILFPVTNKRNRRQGNENNMNKSPRLGFSLVVAKMTVSLGGRNSPAFLFPPELLLLHSWKLTPRETIVAKNRDSKHISSVLIDDIAFLKSKKIIGKH